MRERAVRAAVGSIVVAAACCSAGLLHAGPAAAERVAKTPAFTGGTPKLKTGPPKGTAAGPAVRPSIALTGALPRPKPHVAVDEAGTAYITWLLSTDPVSPTPGGIGFCRLPRGASTCANPPSSQAIYPQKSYGPGDAPAYNQDAESGAYPLVLGDQLFILSTRDVTTYQTPAGERKTTTIAFASTDAGNTFTGGLPVADGVVLTARPVAFGSPDNPLIGLFGPSPGVSNDDAVAFTSVAGGVFTTGAFRLGTSDGGVYTTESPDAIAPLTDGGVAAVYTADPTDGGGGRYVVSTDAAIVRKTTGPGRPTSAAAFSPGKSFPFGTHQDTNAQTTERASLANGPAGLVVGTIGAAGTSQGERAVITPVDGGAPVRVSDETAQDLQLTTAGAEAGKQLVASYLDKREFLKGAVQEDKGLFVRRSLDGKTFTPPERLTLRSEGITNYDVAAGPDGGGFATYQTGDLSAATVRVVPFGPQDKLATPGLPGTEPGQGTAVDGNDGVTRECQRIAVGAVQVTTGDGVGCFLPATGANKGKSVSNGAVLYNGLRITPLNGGQIVIDIAKGTKEVTLYSTGTAKVEIPSKTAGDVLIFEGKLEQKLTAKEGQPFLDLPKFPTTILGFKVAGELAPLALKGGAKIPVDLDLGPQFFGLTGHADLVVDPNAGLQLDSLHVHQDSLPLGPVTIDNLDVSWIRKGNRWDGSAGVSLPSGARLALQASFDSTSFTAQATYDLPFPGVVLFAPPPIVYLHQLSAGIAVNRDGKPLVVNGGVKVGALPLAPGHYALDLSGTLTLTFANPFVVEVRGDLRLLCLFDIASAYVRAGSDGIVRADFSIGIGDKDWAYVGADVKAAVGPPGFEGDGNGEVCVGIKLVSHCQGLPAAHASSKGVAACVTILGTAHTVTYKWGGPLARHKGDTCYYEDISLGLLRGAQARQAPGASGFTVAPGTKTLSVNVQSASGIPRFDLNGPDGVNLDLSAPTVEASSSATQHAASVDITDPKPGRYAILPAAGGPAITGSQVSVPAAKPQLQASLRKPQRGGRGVRYAVSGNKDVTVSFVERTRTGDVVLPGGGRAGTVRFAPNALVSGRHLVVARLATADGFVVEERPVGSFFQPPPRRPKAPRKVRVTPSGSRLKVSIVRSGSARTPMVVTARYGEGGGASAIIPATRTSVTIPGPPPSLNAPGATRIKVQAVSPAGQRSAAKQAVRAGKALQRPRSKQRKR